MDRVIVTVGILMIFSMREKKPKFDKPMLEQTVKLAVKKQLDAIGAFHHWPVQMGLGDRCLDCHGCYKGFYFAVETKAPGKLPTAIQNHTIAKIRAAGGKVFVIDHPDKVPNVLTPANIKS
jgi:hypothetical protein